MHKTFISLAALMALSANAVLAAGNAETGKQKSQICASCHMPDGNSVSPLFPKLAGQNADYLEATLRSYKSGKRKNNVMGLPEGFATKLKDEDIADLAAYFSSQKGLELKY